MSVHFPSQLLTDHQITIATRALELEAAKRRHIVVALSGAHAYGFPSPDSDLDLKAIHVEPTASLLGLGAPTLHADRLEIIEGVEIDYTANELGPVLQGILKGNSNYLERVLGRIQPVVSPELDELRPLTQAALSRRLFWSYQGFARNQLQAVEDPVKATAKKVLYVLRTTLTGAHALDTGRIETNLTALMDGYRFSDAGELIELKRTAERVPLGEVRLERWRKRLDDAFRTLEAARERSPLPEAPTNTADVEAWLLAVRRRYWE